MAKASSKKSGGAVAVACAFDKMVAIGKIKPNPKNPNKHPEAQIDALAKLIKHLGWRAPVTVSNRSGLVVRGHGRLMAAERLGLETVPVDFQDYASEADELSDMLADNKIPELSELDKGLLKSLMSGLKDIGADLSLTAYDLSEIDILMGAVPDSGYCPPIDEADELNKSWGVRRGDLWSIGVHRLMCGDSTKAEDVAFVLGGEKPGIMVTDPPYGVEYSPEFRSGARSKGKITNDDRAGWSAAYGLSTAQVAYVWHADKYAATVQRGLEASGFEVRAQIIWVKGRAPIGRGHYHWAHEPCWYSVRKGSSGAWRGGRKQKTVWGNIIDGFTERDDRLWAVRLDAETVYAFPASATTVWEIKNDALCEGGHSTQKPVECMARPMRNHDAAEVYDPFLGSGTTMVAAQTIGRKCYGIELSPAYCAVILQRMKDNFPGIKTNLVKR